MNAIVHGASATMTTDCRTRVVTIDSAPLTSNPRNTVLLQTSTEGYEVAGSGSRWVNGYWAVRWVDQRSSTTHGRRFPLDAKGETEARAMFAKVTGRMALLRLTSL